jgi:hypothetical protein
MDHDRKILESVSQESYDATDKPFDFLEEGAKTALVCVPDPSVREEIVMSLKTKSYLVTEPGSAREALKSMRFHEYQLVVVDESYEADDPNDNIILRYINTLSIGIRRNIFVMLLSKRFRTMDNMAAFNKSVNLIINYQNLGDFEAILQGGISDHDAFYSVFKDSLRKTGRV